MTERDLTGMNAFGAWTTCTVDIYRNRRRDLPPVDLRARDRPAGFTFNQFLIVADEPLLYHLGPERCFR